MKYEYKNRKLDSIFGYTNFIQEDKAAFSVQTGVIYFLWNRNKVPVQLQVDNFLIELNPNQLLTITYFHKVIFLPQQPPITALLFNREFYCIVDHDDEVSCNGILFFGTQDIPIITIPAEKQRKFDLLMEVILDEFNTQDNIQGDMLQMLLKRFIIICTRLAKEQLVVKELKDTQIDIIRAFNVLVDLHFREKRKVKDYAALLHKSPKTLSNLFATYNHKSPQQIIQERVVLEAKRLLLFTEKQTQEIAYDLGFEDPAHFSRYFKKIATLTPSGYRENERVREVG